MSGLLLMFGLRFLAVCVVWIGLAIIPGWSVMAKPKFFICPKGLERDATVVTEQHDVNLCSRTTQGRSIDLSTETLVAIRNRKTHKQINLPVTTTDDVIYLARCQDGTTYKFDFNRRVLTITSKQGKSQTEKILYSD